MTAHFIIYRIGPKLKYAFYICIMQKHIILSLLMLVFASGNCMEFINFIITYLVHT